MTSTEAPPAPPKRRKRKLLLWAVLIAVVLVPVGYGGFRLWQWIVVPGDAPVVGLSLDTAWHAHVGITTAGYEVALTRAGAKVRVIRPGDEDPETILDSIDALLLAGGGDVDPELYGGDPESAKLVDRVRDDFELALIRGALKRDMPILAICRGIQILNVSQGGTARNLRDEPEILDVHGVTIRSWDAHDVRIKAGTRLAEILGPTTRRASSFHVQAVRKVGEGLTVAAVSPDGVVEAIEMSDRPFVIAMQWHPEVVPQQIKIFHALVAAAKQYQRSRTRR